MADFWQNTLLSTAARSVRRQFWIGIALVSVIPILVALYLMFVGPCGTGGMGDPCYIPMYVMVILLGIIGYFLLASHPRKISELRTDMEHIIGSGFPGADKDGLTGAEDDIAAIEKYMNLIASKLEGKVETAEQATEQLQRQLHLVRKMESLSIMASGLAHDFNNLLAAVIGNACIVLRNLPQESQVKENARQIEATALRAIELANLIHLYSGKSRLVEEDVNVTAIVKEMGGLMNVPISRGINVEYHLDECLPNVNGDSTQVRQAIMNLFTNAADAIPDGKGTITVSTGVKECTREYLSDTYVDENLPEGKYIFFEISDTGCGIEPQVQERMFDPFYTAKIRGRGLGLSVVLGVVRSHNGAIKVKSAPGQGSTFTLLFPIAT